MRAVVATATSRDDPLSCLAIADRPEPEPQPDWEVVEVRAASLNHHDLWTLRGVGVAEDHLPVTLGGDAAGVTADGREVIVHSVLGTPAVGQDETLAEDLHLLSERGVPGTLAQRVAVPRRNLVPKPPNLSWAEAACLPTAYLTAYRMLFTRARLRPGDRVLVQGAGGGVSTAAIVLGAAAGLVVYATSRSPEKRARAVELGARECVEPGSRLPERVDAVIETVGEATWGHSLRSLRPDGVVVVSGATTGSGPPAELSRIFWRQLSVIGSTMGTLDELRRLVSFLETTGARPVVDGEWPLERAPEAFARLHGGEAFGKIVVLPAADEIAELEEAFALAELGR
jgi:NADPH:quinone reductase-like Zn-dependent oxidoreductase